MKILVTGAAGFIGFHVSRGLLENGHVVVGLDNINAYYDTDLKFARLQELGILRSDAEIANKTVLSSQNSRFSFIRLNLEDKNELEDVFVREQFDVVCHLAAQAGVRYSLENPESYIKSNIEGFFNILENCRHAAIKHLVYASSSSVYGLNAKIPFSTKDPVDQPISLYAASKKSNELMAHTYSHLFDLPTTGLRFFTVYGPWGRPDMALFLFTEAILKDKPIEVFNNGNLERDFTYIDDITEGVIRVVEKEVDSRKENGKLYKVYNIGNNRSVQLMDFIQAIEKNLGKKAQKIMTGMQAGDVEKTWADVEDLKREYGYTPDTSIEKGISEFIKWYKGYFKVE